MGGTKFDVLRFENNGKSLFDRNSTTKVAARLVSDIGSNNVRCLIGFAAGRTEKRYRPISRSSDLLSSVSRNNCVLSCSRDLHSASKAVGPFVRRISISLIARCLRVSC